jgi:hypothetical protein
MHPKSKSLPQVERKPFFQRNDLANYSPRTRKCARILPGDNFFRWLFQSRWEQSGGNSNKAIGDLANAGKLNVRAGVYDLAAGKISLS